MPKDEIERKWLVEVEEQDLKGLPFYGEMTSSEISQTYLKEPGARVRCRIYRDGSKKGQVEHTFTQKKAIGPGHFEEEERLLTRSEYGDLLTWAADPSRVSIHKNRWLIPWEGRTWELDIFRKSLRGIAVLEVELDKPSELLDPNIKPPPFIKVVREVTGINWWSNQAMALKTWVREPTLVAGQVWRKGKESFEVLSVGEDGTGIRATAFSVEGEYAIWKPHLVPVEIDEILREGWVLD